MIQPGKTIQLPSGKELQIDLNQITRKEWRSLFNIKQPDEEEAAIMGKILGISGSDYENLGLADWRIASEAVYKFFEEFTKAARDTSDPKV